jgi:GntR family transcriptional regulator
MAKQYERIADDLRQEIQGGNPGPGARLPSESVLTTRYKVSPPTVRQALGVLEAEGLIERRHGLGTFVREPRQKVRRTTERYQWEKDRARLSHSERASIGATERDTGLAMSDLDFFAEYRTEPANADLAEAFDIPAGTKLLHRVYRTRLKTEDAPLSLIDSYLVYSTVAANPDLLSADNEPWPGATQNQLYTVGIELDRITDQITARPPRADEAELLEIGAGTSVIVLRKTSIDTHDRVVEISDVVMPGDRTVVEYTTRLTRWEP